MAGLFRSTTVVRQNLDKVAYNAIRSIQYIQLVLDPDTSSDQAAPGVSFTDFTKVVLIPLNLGSTIAGNAGAIPNIYWKVVSNTNITVFHGIVNGTDVGTAVVAAYAVEFI